MAVLDVEMKVTERLRMAEAVGVAPTHGHVNVSPVFAERLPVVSERLAAEGVTPGRLLACFEWPDDAGRIVVHLGFEIGDQPFTGDDEVHAMELPREEVASTVHRGSLDDFGDTFLALMAWIDAHDYYISGRSRELYVVNDVADPANRVTELQIPVVRAS